MRTTPSLPASRAPALTRVGRVAALAALQLPRVAVLQQQRGGAALRRVCLEDFYKIKEVIFQRLHRQFRTPLKKQAQPDFNA